MRSIELQLRGEYFAIDLIDLSEWLTRKQINPSRFTYSADQVDDSVHVRVDFLSQGDADLFSDKFSGRTIAQMPLVYPAVSVATDQRRF
jgi:hypothetical protein